MGYTVGVGVGAVVGSAVGVAVVGDGVGAVVGTPQLNVGEAFVVDEQVDTELEQAPVSAAD